MPTIKQKRAIAKMVENGGNASRAMIDVGYSPMTAKVPGKLTNSDGFKELCEEYGLTDDFLVKALVSDIKKKPKNRKPELELAFKVKGRLKEKDDKPNQTNNFFFFDEDQRARIARRIMARKSVDNSGSAESSN